MLECVELKQDESEWVWPDTGKECGMAALCLGETLHKKASESWRLVSEMHWGRGPDCIYITAV